MQPVKPKWLRSGLVLVCERCTRERIPQEDPDVAERIGDFNLREWLKTKLKEDGHWGAVRAISTSCMDVCAPRHVTVCIDPKDGRPADVLAVDPLEDRDELYARIILRLAQDDEV